MEEYFELQIQKLVNKYHCHAERYNDAAENDVLVFYAGTYTKRYLLCRVYLDEFNLSIKTYIDGCMSKVKKLLDTYDVNLIDAVNNGQLI